MKYKNFTVEDFLADEFFQQWILAPDEQNDAFWKNWTEQNPDKKSVIQQALNIAKSFGFSEKWNEQERLSMWENIESAVSRTPITHRPFLQRINWKPWLAAAGIVMILTGLAIFRLQNNLHETATSFGQIKKITLADGSVITLNANSKLRYARNFLNEKEREIWIDGEAFFEVKKRIVDGKKVPFVVHANDLMIQVLGTAFNVANRRGEVNVALQHGAVAVSDLNNKKNTVILKPGESVSQAGSKNMLLTEKVDVAQYASWKNKVIIFRKKSLADLSVMMKDLYDLKVIIDNRELDAETFTGSFPTDSSQVLFDKLQKMYPLEVTKIGDEYHIR